MSMVGVFAGGLSVARLGVMRSMVIGAFALPITNTIFAWLATQGPDIHSLLIAIGIDNVVSGYAGTCLVAYMSSLTSAGFTITQYALFSSLYSLPGKLLGLAVGPHRRGRRPRGAQPAVRWPRCAACSPTPRPRPSPTPWPSRTSAPTALGAGYVAFFFYSGLVGVLPMALAVLVAWRTRTASFQARPEALINRARARTRPIGSGSAADQRQAGGDRFQLARPRADLVGAEALARTVAAPPARTTSRR